jgi:hypothetical protein
MITPLSFSRCAASWRRQLRCFHAIFAVAAIIVLMLLLSLRFTRHYLPLLRQPFRH